MAGTTPNYTCSPDATHGANGCLTNDPRFVDAAGGDVRLSPLSPCVDAGSNGSVDTSQDVYGHPRIVFGTVDMGAAEFVVSSDDYDGDGMSNAEEIAADTDSREPGSMLSIVDVAGSNGQQLVWIGGVQARQFVEVKYDLLSTTEPWVAIYTNEPDTPITNVLDLQALPAAGTRYYRISVE